MTSAPNDVPVLDIAGISRAYQRSVEDACPEGLPLAMRVLARLEPERWTLEWYLPWWLGHGFGLDREFASELVLGNILGLASIRLQDDLLDGEVAVAEVDAATTLSAALYRLALAPYQAKFPATSPFWAHLERCMSVWRAAARANGNPGGAAGDGEGESPLLAGRGAPLKISAFAVCLLAARVDAFPALDECLDLALTGLVLYDHFGDWQHDLGAGRWNAFVASVSNNPQTPEFRDRNRSRVLLAMMNEDAITEYFARIEMEVARARALVGPLGLSPMADHLGSFGSALAQEGPRNQAYYRDVAEGFARSMLNDSRRGQSADRHPAAAVPGRA